MKIKEEVERMHSFDGIPEDDEVVRSAETWNEEHRLLMDELKSFSTPADNYELTRIQRIQKYTQLIALSSELVGHVRNGDVSDEAAGFAYFLLYELEHELDLSYHATKGYMDRDIKWGDLLLVNSGKDKE